MIDEWWASLTIEQKMVINCNKIRRLIINAFVAIESIIADMVVVVDRDCNYLEYYKKFKPSKSIIEDFFSCYDKFQPFADNYFTSKENLKLDLEYLVKIRNRAAHSQWINDDFALGIFDKEHYHFFSIHFAHEECMAISLNAANDFQNTCMRFIGPLISLQSEVYETLSHIPTKITSETKISNSERLTIKGTFNSLKN